MTYARPESTALRCAWSSVSEKSVPRSPSVRKGGCAKRSDDRPTAQGPLQPFREGLDPKSKETFANAAA